MPINTYEQKPAELNLKFEKGDYISFIITVSGIDLATYTFKSTFAILQDSVNKNKFTLSMSSDLSNQKEEKSEWFFAVYDTAGEKLTLIKGILFLE